MDKSWKNEKVSSPVVHRKFKKFANKSCLQGATGMIFACKKTEYFF